MEQTQEKAQDTLPEPVPVVNEPEQAKSPEVAESVVVAPSAPVKRKQGRPPKTKADPPKDEIKWFPVPPTLFFHDDKETPSHRVKSFISYWRRVATDAQYAGRPYCTVYRLWPVIDRAVLKKKKQIADTDAYLENVEDIWHRWGSGDYLFYLCDNAAPSGKKNICRCVVSGMRDLDNYPPVLETEDLVVTDPKNNSYLQWRRQKGLPVPGEDPKQESEEVGVVTELMQQNRELVKELTDKSRQPPAPVYPYPDDLLPVEDEEGAGQRQDARGSRAVLDMVTMAGKTAIKMTQDAAEKLSTAHSQAADPVDSFTKIAAAVQALFPKTDNAPLLAMIHAAEERALKAEERYSQEQAARLKAMEERLTERVAQNASPGAQGARSFADELRERVEVQRLMKELVSNPDANGEADDDEAPKRSKNEPWYVGMLPWLIPAGMFMVSSVGALMHNLAVAKTGQGAPAAPPAVPPDAVPPEAREQLVEAQRAIGGSGNGAPGGVPGQNPQQASQEQNTMDQVKFFIAMIKQPLLTHLAAPDMDGHDFAAWMMQGFPMQYKQIVGSQHPKDDIVGAIRQHDQELWQVIQSLGTSADQFLDEFIQGPPPEDGEEQ